jgi:hypothetical protein
VDRELAVRPDRLTPDFSSRKSAANDRARDRTDQATDRIDRARRARGPDRITRRNRLGAQLTLVAAVWSLSLVVAAVALPVVNSTTTSPQGTTFVTETLVAAQGWWVLIPVAVPLVITGVVALALRGRRRARPDGAQRSRWVAWAGVALLTAFALLSILSIGGFVLPVAILLACATGLSRGAAAPIGPDRDRRARRA